MQHRMFKHTLRSKKRTRRLMYMDQQMRELLVDFIQHRTLMRLG